MEIHFFTVGPFQEHTYILSDPDTASAIIVDPGGFENEKVLAYLKERDLKVKSIYSTHGHIDHIAGAYDLQKTLEAPYYLNKNDEYLLENLETICKYFGFPNVTRPTVAGTIQAGTDISFGAQTLEVIETPGHTPGGVCFYTPGDVFVGDTLFYGSVGRTDLPGGNTETLISAIQSKLLILPGQTRVHCGHGPKTTIQREKDRNPFLAKGHRQYF